MEKFTDQELSMLSDEERAAIEDDGDDDSFDHGQDSPTQKTERRVEEDGSVTEIISDDDDDAEQADEQTKPAGEAKSAEPDQAENDDKPFQARYHAPEIDGYDEKVAALKSSAEELKEKYKEGDITFDEYEEQREKLAEESRLLHDSKLKAEIAADQNEQTAQQKWDWECQRFMRNTARLEGIDYRTEGSAKLFSTFNNLVIALGNDPAFGNKDGEAILAEAHRLTKLRHGLGETEKARATPQKDPVKAAVESRRPNLKGISDTTVAHLPPAGDAKKDPDVGGNEFADLENLTGADYEDRLAAMTPEQERRYLEG